MRYSMMCVREQEVKHASHVVYERFRISNDPVAVGVNSVCERCSALTTLQMHEMYEEMVEMWDR